jgi:hypothetical protein
VAGIIGLLPNKFITPVEGNQISLDSSDLIHEGTHEITESKYVGVDQLKTVL